MTPAQRNLLWEWVASLFLLAVVMLLGAPIIESWHWLRWPALVVAVLFRVVANQGYIAGGGSNVISDTVASHRWLNWWAAICTVAIVGAAFSAMDTLSHMTKAAVLRQILLALAVAFGPAIVLVERRRFQERGVNAI